MRPAEFSENQIISAGKALQLENRNITGFALRQKVGGGSPARLKQVWDEYEASTTQTAPVINKTSDLPPEVADSINEFCASITKQINSVATELNEKAINAAERKVHEVVKNGIEQRAQDQKEIDDASKTVEDLDNKLDESKTEIEALKSELAKANELNQNLTLKHAQTSTELETVKASLSELIATANADFNKSKVLIETNQKQEIEIAKLRERMLIVDESAQAAKNDLNEERAKKERALTDLAHAGGRLESIPEFQNEIQRLNSKLDEMTERMLKAENKTAAKSTT